MADNKEYQNDVFSMLLEDPNNALTLYNAINGTDYRDADMVEMCRLDGGVSLSVCNDATFILDMRLSLYEYQSLICPNKPIRSFVYLANISEGMIKNHIIYAGMPAETTIPRFAIFYNGDEEQPEQYELAIDRCIKENVLRDFLMNHRTEIVEALILDYNFERQLTLDREDRLTEGYNEGLAAAKSEKYLLKY